MKIETCPLIQLTINPPLKQYDVFLCVSLFALLFPNSAETADILGDYFPEIKIKIFPENFSSFD